MTCSLAAYCELLLNPPEVQKKLEPPTYRIAKESGRASRRGSVLDKPQKPGHCDTCHKPLGFRKKRFCSTDCRNVYHNSRRIIEENKRYMKAPRHNAR